MAEFRYSYMVPSRGKHHMDNDRSRRQAAAGSRLPCVILDLYFNVQTCIAINYGPNSVLPNLYIHNLRSVSRGRSDRCGNGYFFHMR